MSIFHKIFGAPQQPVAQPQPGITNNVATNPAPAAPTSSPGTAPNGVVPAGGANPGTGATSQPSPEDKFATLWDPNKTEETQAPNQPTGLTPEKIREAAGKLDFTQVLDQNSLQKIAAGGEEAMQALAGLLNKTAQATYAQSITVANKMIETQLAAAKEDFASQVPNLVKKQAMQDSLLTANPAFKNPAVAPVVAAIQSQLTQKYPNATASELNEMAQEYLKQAAGVFNPAPKQTADPSKAGVDWDDYMTQNTAS